MYDFTTKWYFLNFSETQILFNIFNKYKIEARFVGGCVRDAITNIITTDFDLAVNYSYNNLLHILSTYKYVKISSFNSKYFNINLSINNRQYQITTLRKDINCNGRGCNVIATNSFAIDAQRRDFTINALYVDINGKLFDYFSGVNDLLQKQIIFIGNPIQRIIEDKVRILRYYRFCAKYEDYSDRYNHIMKLYTINNLSNKRIGIELFKIIQESKTTNIINCLIKNKIISA